MHLLSTNENRTKKGTIIQQKLSTKRNCAAVQQQQKEEITTRKQRKKQSRTIVHQNEPREERVKASRSPAERHTEAIGDRKTQGHEMM